MPRRFRTKQLAPELTRDRSRKPIRGGKDAVATVAFARRALKAQTEIQTGTVTTLQNCLELSHLFFVFVFC